MYVCVFILYQNIRYDEIKSGQKDKFNDNPKHTSTTIIHTAGDVETHSATIGKLDRDDQMTKTITHHL